MREKLRTILGDIRASERGQFNLGETGMEII